MPLYLSVRCRMKLPFTKVYDNICPRRIAAGFFIAATATKGKVPHGYRKVKPYGRALRYIVVFYVRLRFPSIIANVMIAFAAKI